MGKHETGYARIERDFCPTPAWVVEALSEHVEIAGKAIWEPACGDGHMAEAFKTLGAAHVHATDIADYGYPESKLQDFLTATALPPGVDLIATNPPFGGQGGLAVKFIEKGLQLISGCEMLALLLSVDFDSGVTRRHLFANNPAWLAKIVLLDRIAWYANPDPKKENPKENCCWYVWSHAPHDYARIFYADTRRPKRARLTERAPLIITNTEVEARRV